MIWTGHTIPALYNGFPIEVETTDGPKRFNLAKSSPVGLTETYVTPLGAEGRQINLRVRFDGTYFEAHKQFLALLDATVVPGVPGVLAHPVWGEIQVYPESYTPTVNARELSAVVDVVFQRHFVTVEVLTPGVFFLNPWVDQAIILPLTGYLLMLGFMAAWNSAFIAATLLLIRLLGQIPALFERTTAAASAALAALIAAAARDYAALADPTAADPRQPETAPDLFCSRAHGSADKMLESFYTASTAPRQTITAVADGDEAYEAGVFSGRLPLPAGVISPSPRLHAPLVIGAVWEAMTSGQFAASLAVLLARQSRQNALDVQAADAAILATRRRIARAVRLLGAGLGIHAAPAIRALSAQASQLNAFIGSEKKAAFATRQVTVNAVTPLPVLALRELGDASRAVEIRNLNRSLRRDLNRLPRGTVLTVPAG